MSKARTGSIEPFKRADGSTYYRARVRLSDASQTSSLLSPDDYDKLTQ